MPHLGHAADVSACASFVDHVFGEHLGKWESGAMVLAAWGGIAENERQSCQRELEELGASA